MVQPAPPPPRFGQAAIKLRRRAADLMGMRGKACALALTAALWVALAGAATGAELRGLPTPLATTVAAGTGSCPTAEDLSGAALAAAGRDAIDDAVAQVQRRSSKASTAIFIADLLAFSLIGSQAVIAVCDPALAQAGSFAGTITGSALHVPSDESAGPGLRVRAASLMSPGGAAAAVGDRFALPPVSSAATIDLAVRTSTGAATQRLGPFPSSPTAVVVQAGPTVVVQLASGEEQRVPVTAPQAAPAGKLAVDARSKDRLRITVDAAPRAIILGRRIPRTWGGGDDAAWPIGVADNQGRLSRGLNVKSTQRALQITAVDPERRNVTSWRCLLRWRKGRVIPSNCQAKAARLASSKPQRPSSTPEYDAPTPRPQPRAPAREHSPTGEPAAGRSAAAALQVSVALSTRDSGLIYGDEIGRDLIGDVTGDGRPELTIGDGLSAPYSLLVSQRAGGWRQIELTQSLRASSPPQVIPDITGDGIDDLAADGLGSSLDETLQLLPGAASWSTTAPPAISFLPMEAGGAQLSGASLVASTDRTQSVQLLPDATGDGRRELVTAQESWTGRVGAVWASEQWPLGRATQFPGAWFGREQIASLRELKGEPDLPGGERPAPLKPARFNGERWVPTGDRTLVLTTSGATRSGMDLRVGWLQLRDGKLIRTPAAGGPVRVPLPAVEDPLLDVDPVSGELLWLAKATCRARRCRHSVLRLGGDGRITGRLSAIGGCQSDTGGETLMARFIDDGPDADARPEAVFSTADRPNVTRPAAGDDRTIGLWPSVETAPAQRSLAVVMLDGEAARRLGPLRGSTDTSGRHHVALWTVRGSGRKARYELITLSQRP